MTTSPASSPTPRACPAPPASGPGTTPSGSWPSIISTYAATTATPRTPTASPRRCATCTEADRDVVLPAIILHDTGWSKVPADVVLEAIRPGAGRHDLVIRHEKEGAAIAADILGRLGHDPAETAEIVEIIDGHDSRLTSLSLNDSLVKDADKLWRLTPHGLDTVMDWFGLTREQAHTLIGSRVHDHLFTDAARTMARALAAVATIDSTPQRTALG
ncbi:HD domain-containing protein [Streptomyces sp. NPDC004838]